MLIKSTIILLLMMTSQIQTAPTIDPKPTSTMIKRSISTSYYDPNSLLAQSRNVKKDVFMSRGWGAGGMPFSVLYMSPSSSRAPVEQAHNKPVAPMPKPKEQQHRMRNQVAVRNPMGGMGNIRAGRKNYSIIPQLFVSYGWGPAGK